MNQSITHADGSRTIVTDNGDGTGIRTEYDDEGNVTETVELTGLPIPVLIPDPVALVAGIYAGLAALDESSTLADLRTALLSVRASLDAALNP